MCNDKKCGSDKPKFITGEVVSSEGIIDLGEDKKSEEQEFEENQEVEEEQEVEES